MALLILCLSLLVAISALFSASETALFSLSAMQLRSFEHSQKKACQRAAYLLKDPQKLLVTILMLNVFVNLAIQNVVSSIFGTFSSILLTVGVPLVIVLIFGEVVPKSIALGKNTPIALAVAPLILLTEKLLRYPRDIVVAITRPISRYMFFYLKPEEPISVHELKHSLRTSKEYGILHEDEAHLVRGYLNLQDYTVKEVMTPRQDIIAYDINTPLSELTALFVEERCSRVPVYDGDLEHLLGIMTARAFLLFREAITIPSDIKPYLDKIEYLPETMGSKTLLHSLYERGIEMVIVVDEYGSITGLVTLEDVVEVIFGQIADSPDESALYTMSSPDVMICSGKLEIKEFEELFDIHLESPNNMATVGGYLMEKMGEIPKAGDKYSDGPFLFHVLAADVNRVRRIYVRKVK